jgi:mono/diheme cytochrome c family protein
MKSYSLRKLTAYSLAFAFLTAFFLGGCTWQTERTVMEFMPHMANTPVLKAQKGYDGLGTGSSVMMPPENTVPRGHRPYRIQTVEEAAAKLRNPLPRTRVTLGQGRKVYNIYCLVCHGERGAGDGPIVDPFPIPKSLHSEEMLRWNDGHLFHVLTVGQGVMPGYEQQISTEDRWAVIHYVRALQRAQNPTDADIRELQKRYPQN